MLYKIENPEMRMMEKIIKILFKEIVKSVNKNWSRNQKKKTEKNLKGKENTDQYLMLE